MRLIDADAVIDAFTKLRIEKMQEGKDVSLVWKCLDKVMQVPTAQSERQIELDGTESNVEILSELRAQFNCFDKQEEPVYRALSDAISALKGWWSYPLPAQPEEKVLTEEDYAYCLECNHVEMCRWYPMYGCEFKGRPSAQPEIIRCKDCEYWDRTWQNDWAKDYHYCPVIDGVRNGDWYCADAERRTE